MRLWMVDVDCGLMGFREMVVIDGWVFGVDRRFLGDRSLALIPIGAARICNQGNRSISRRIDRTLG